MTHPLATVTETELADAVALLRDLEVAGPTTTFHRLALDEPDNADLARFADGAGDTDRRVAAVLWHRDRRVVEEVTVSLRHRSVLARDEIPDAVPIPGLLEQADAVTCAKCDAGVLEALAKRGVTDTDKVQVDPWPTGSFDIEAEAGRRVVRCVFFYRERPQDNGYSRPLDGLMAHVDLDEMKVIHIDDIGIWPTAPSPVNYDAESVIARDGLRPIEITQPDGINFTVNGNEISWQGWRMHAWIDPTEALVLHSIGYDDGNGERSIIRRASLAEMVVPYGEVRPSQAFKNALDAGEIGLGRFVNSLTLGCDCLGEITYLDAPFAMETGDVYTVENAICIHEEDYGILWKHTDLHTMTTEVRRSRRLVVSSVHTAGNYEYGFFWHFYLDGTIELVIKLTGCLTPMGYVEGDDLRFASLVAPGVAAPYHQHHFCFRLDMAVDGERNSVDEVDLVALPVGPDNPYGNAFTTRTTRLTSSAQARRDAAPEVGRTWRIGNARSINGLGEPRSYKLLPGPSPAWLPGPAAQITGRAGFAQHALWVTPTRASERFAAGTHVSQSGPATRPGLPTWAARDEPVEDCDLTVWHTFGVNHVPRPEDFPVMPVEYVGFQLMPVGFFERNPALDVAPTGHCD